MSQEMPIHTQVIEAARKPVAEGSVLYRVLEVIAQQIARRLAADGAANDSACAPKCHARAASADRFPQSRASRRQSVTGDQSETSTRKGQC
jgi:hypothetical protein